MTVPSKEGFFGRTAVGLGGKNYRVVYFNGLLLWGAGPRDSGNRDYYWPTPDAELPELTLNKPPKDGDRLVIVRRSPRAPYDETHYNLFEGRWFKVGVPLSETTGALEGVARAVEYPARDGAPRCGQLIVTAVSAARVAEVADRFARFVSYFGASLDGPDRLLVRPPGPTGDALEAAFRLGDRGLE